MKSIIVIEKMVNKLELTISSAKKQLSKHESGEEKLTLFAKSAAENSIDKHSPLLNKYKELLKECRVYNKLDEGEHQRFRDAIERKKYYKYNNKQKDNKKIKYKINDERIEAVMIMDELSEELKITNKELFDLSFQNIQEYMMIPSEMEKDFEKIMVEFESQIKDFKNENIKNLELLNYMVPIIIFHFHVFMLHIIEYKTVVDGVEMNQMNFFPKYNDWWISEMWTSHIAYFSLYNWKDRITELCITSNQKNVWEIIFNNWIFLKTLLSEKSDTAFEYQFIVDSLIEKYVNLSSELDIKIVNKMKNNIEGFIREEELSLFKKKHDIVTPYIKYKVNNPL